MAVMLDADRIIVRNTLARDLSDIRETTGLNKTEWKAAVDNTDQWISDNQTAYNNALPLAAQTGLTKQQKARLFLEVAERRFEVDV